MAFVFVRLEGDPPHISKISLSSIATAVTKD